MNVYGMSKYQHKYNMYFILGSLQGPTNVYPSPSGVWKQVM